MSKRNSIILGLLFVILVVEIIVLAPKELGISPAEDAPVTKTPAAASFGTGQVMKDVHLVEAKADGKEWELWASEAVRAQADEDWKIQKVRVKFFAADGVIYTVTGKKGLVVPTKNDIRIEGDVVTRSSNGYVFKTESVLYDSKARKLTSPTSVEMQGIGEKEGDRMHLTGSEMVAALATNEITITKNVRARKRIDATREAVIQSQKGSFSGRTNQAHFSGNVVIDFDSMRIAGPQASFSYDPKSKSFESVNVEGGVKMTDSDKFATSKTVNVHFKDERVIFNGSPRVVQNGDELVGDRIVLLDGGKRVQVSNARAQIDPNRAASEPENRQQ